MGSGWGGAVIGGIDAVILIAYVGYIGTIVLWQSLNALIPESK